MKPLLQTMSTALKTEKMFLFARRGISVDYPPSRPFGLVQIGFFFTGNPPHDPTSLAEKLREVATVSSLSALTLFSERERYFEKAIRHSMVGTMIKVGPKTDLKGEYEHLRRLHGYNTPTLLDTGGFEENNTVATWYSMSKVASPSMAEMLSVTNGLEGYEVDSLVRSIFLHLRETYWGTPGILTATCNQAAQPEFALARGALKALRERHKNLVHAGNEKDVLFFDETRACT